jgi:hypothetical protein
MHGVFFYDWNVKCTTCSYLLFDLLFLLFMIKKDFEIASQLPEHLFGLDKQRRAQ